MVSSAKFNTKPSLKCSQTDIEHLHQNYTTKWTDTAKSQKKLKINENNKQTNLRLLFFYILGLKVCN
jgi:hypothetical protein